MGIKSTVSVLKLQFCVKRYSIPNCCNKTTMRWWRRSRLAEDIQAFTNLQFRQTLVVSKMINWIK